MKDDLTAASRWPPAVRYVSVLQAAGSVIGIQELTVQFVHCRIFAHSVNAGGDVGLWVDETATGGERRLLE